MSDDLLTEISTINAIYTPTTILPHHSPTPLASASTSTTYILTLPSSSSISSTSDSSISLLLTFPTTYPALPPTIDGTASVGPHAKKGTGQRVLEIARAVLSEVWREEEVVLFDFVEELGGRLISDGIEDEVERETGVTGYGSSDYEQGRRREGGIMCDGRVRQDKGGAEDNGGEIVSDTGTPHAHQQHQHQQHHNNIPSTQKHPSPSLSSFPPPIWTISTPLTIKKSLFLARACPISSPAHASSCLEHLLATDKHARKATHNICAYRSQTISVDQHQDGEGKSGEEEIEYSDDDGEDAAGGRLLNLLHLMDMRGVLVVVSRWYGGVKLGGARFGAIGGVAREVLGRIQEDRGERGKAKVK